MTSKSIKVNVYKGQVLEEEGGDLSRRGGEGVRSNDIRVSALFPAWHERTILFELEKGNWLH